MYWYLSFLRPPPVTISTAAQSITITPQVANDLRTETRYEPTEIYYTWQLLSSGSDTGGFLQVDHLTTYRSPESTYKAISIPLPPSIRAGHEWRLGLFPSSTGPRNQHISSVLKKHPELDVIGVWSEPMQVTGSGPSTTTTSTDRPSKKSKTEDKANSHRKGKGKGKAKDDEGPKQTRIHREWITGTEDAQTRLRIIEQTSFDLDKKIWDSGLALSAWLGHHLAKSKAQTNERLSRVLRLLARSEEGETLRVLELGSGTGLVSIALRQTLQRIGQHHGDVEITATDLDSAMELMNENLALNELEHHAPSPQISDREDTATPDTPRTGGISLSANTLDWDEELPSWVTSHHPDLIVAADVTYNTASFPCLVKTLSALLQPLSGERPPLLLAYKQRDEAERDLWKMLKAEGIELELVDKVPGAEEEGAVEIWVGGRRT